MNVGESAEPAAILQRTVVSTDGFKVIEDLRRHTLEAYDLATDPGELVDAVDGPDPRAEERVREMRDFFGRNESPRNIAVVARD